MLIKINLGNWSKTDTVVTQIENGVVGTNEYITQDPEIGTHVGEGRHTVGGIIIGNIDDVHIGSQGEDGAANGEVQVGQGGDGGAVNKELTFVVFAATNDFVDGFVGSLGSNDQGGASIGNSLAVGADIVARHISAVHGELPVALFGNIDIGDITGVQVGVDTTQNQFTTLSSGTVTGQVEGEDIGVNQTLGVHVVEGRDDIVDGNRLVGHTEDTIEAGSNKAGTGFRGGFGEGLGLDGQTIDGDGIGGQVAGQTARAVLDGEGFTVSNIGGGGRGIVLVVVLAGGVGGSAAGSGDPQVGGARIEQNFEFLWWSTDGDLAVVFHVQGVGQIFFDIVAGSGQAILGAQDGQFSLDVGKGFLEVFLTVNWHTDQFSAGQSGKGKENEEFHHDC